MTKATQTAYAAARDAFDNAVTKLAPADYLEVINELQAHLECCENCLRDENPELFE